MKAAAYARYSTDRQTDNSIAYQLNGIREYCKKENIEIIHAYTDEAQTGTNADREGFDRLCNDAQIGLFDTVVIYDIQRGSRDVADWFIFRKEMYKLGVKVLSPNAQIGDLLNPDDFLLELLNVGLGQREVLATRQKVIAGQTARAKEGVFLGGIAPLGYDIVDQQYVINEREAKIVRTIFTMYASGKSYGDIVDALKDERGKRGQHFGKNSLSSILRNDRYTGLYTWNRRNVKQMRKWAGGGPNPNIVQIEGIIPRIIDERLWERVQMRLKDRKRNAAAGAKREYLLSGLIECGECGASYVGHTVVNKKGYEYKSYMCGNKTRTHTCDNKNISAKMIEDAAVKAVKEYLEEMDIDKAVDEVCKKVNLVTADLSKEKKELGEIERKLNNAAKLMIEMPEMREEFLNQTHQLKLRKSELDDIIYAHERKDRGVDPEKLRAYLQDGISTMNSDGSSKDLLKQHITKIYAYKDEININIGVRLSGSGGRI